MPILHTHIVPHPPLIVPAVGRGREKDIRQTITAYTRVAESIAADRPDLILFITPHGPIYKDYIHIAPGQVAEGDFVRFGAAHARYTLTYDEPFIQQLTQLADMIDLPAGTLGGEHAEALDHGVLVPLHFISTLYTDFKAARISISGLSHEQHYLFGQCIADALSKTDRRAVIIASGDLSHKLTQDGPYGYAPQGPDFDRQVCEAMFNGDFLRFLQFDDIFCEQAAECGLRSFIMMAGALDGREVSVDFQSYEGPFGVGYAVCSYEPGSANEKRCFLRHESKDAYVQLARQTLEHYIRTGKTLPCPSSLPDEMLNSRAGTFVSLKKNGQLRGCIGTISPARASIAEEIIGNAISAGTCDPRFDAITEEELPYLVYSVDVLSPAEPISGMEDLDVTRYGVIVSSGYKRGLLLPNLEGVNTVAEQIAIALHKAGLKATDPYTLSRFEVVRHT